MPVHEVFVSVDYSCDLGDNLDVLMNKLLEKYPQLSDLNDGYEKENQTLMVQQGLRAVKSNEKFGGKGRSQHICKDCQRQIQEEKLTKMQVLKMEKAYTNYILATRPSCKYATKISKIKQ